MAWKADSNATHAVRALRLNRPKPPPSRTRTTSGPYHVAVKILAKPRAEGGLNLITSKTALCRYYTHHDPGQAVIEQMGQYADAVRVKGQAHSGALLEAMFILVQNRLLRLIRSAKPLPDLEREFRILERMQRCFHADQKRRKEQPSAATRASQQTRSAEIICTPDFVRSTSVPCVPSVPLQTNGKHLEIPRIPPNPVSTISLH